MKMIFRLLTLVLCFAACKKDSLKSAIDQLPPATQTGANTFGCLMNGVPIATTMAYKTITGEGVKTYPGPYKGIYIDAKIASGSEKKYFYLYFKYDSSIIGKHLLQSDGNGISSSVWLISDAQTKIYTPRNANGGSIDITRFSDGPDPNSSVGAILSGNFDALFANNSGDTLRLTNGRFDIKYQ